VAIIFLTHLTTYSIIALGRQKQMIKFYSLAAALAVAGYLWLIPKYSYLAAAGVTVFVEGFMLLATIYLLKKHFALQVDLSVFGKAMLSAVGMGLMLTFVINWNVLILLIIGAVAYFGFLWLNGGISKKLIKEFTN